MKIDINKIIKPRHLIKYCYEGKRWKYDHEQRKSPNKVRILRMGLFIELFCKSITCTGALCPKEELEEIKKKMEVID